MTGYHYKSVKNLYQICKGTRLHAMDDLVYAVGYLLLKENENMKFRSDFVTNSSSSSYLVQITIEDINGKKYEVEVDTGYGGERSGNVDMDLKADEILNAKSVSELLDLINNGVLINEPTREEEEEYLSEFAEADRPLSEEERCKNLMMDYASRVNKNIQELDGIKKVSFKRIWFAKGEYASCFGYNIDYYAPDLEALAESVKNAEGAEKEKAEKQLSDYLNDFPETIESFPESFMGVEAPPRIVWNQFAASLEELADGILDQKIPNRDYAEYVTEIDMSAKSIRYSAEYILDGYPVWIG